MDDKPKIKEMQVIRYGSNGQVMIFQIKDIQDDETMTTVELTGEWEIVPMMAPPFPHMPGFEEVAKSFNHAMRDMLKHAPRTLDLTGRKVEVTGEVTPGQDTYPPFKKELQGEFIGPDSIDIYGFTTEIAQEYDGIKSFIDSNVKVPKTAWNNGVIPNVTPPKTMTDITRRRPEAK